MGLTEILQGLIIEGIITMLEKVNKLNLKSIHIKNEQITSTGDTR